MLNVRGDSMIEAGIHDGDLILVEQQNVARNGDIVVAMVNGMESEATVKTFYKESDHIRLQPENSTMEPIRVKDVAIVERKPLVEGRHMIMILAPKNPSKEAKQAPKE